MGRVNNSQIRSGIRKIVLAPKVKAAKDRPWIAGRFKEFPDAAHHPVGPGDVHAGEVQHAAGTRKGVLHIDNHHSGAGRIDLQWFGTRVEGKCRHAQFAHALRSGKL